MKLSLKLLFVFMSLITCAACGSNPTPKVVLNKPYNPVTGVGRFSNFKVDSTVNKALAIKGVRIYHQKCKACHSLGENKVIGPGWKGITHRETAAWIMNYLTNTEVMLQVDPKLQKLIATGSPQMPDQNLSDKEAMAVLAFMRQNDGQ